MAGSAGVDQEIEIRGGTHSSPHDRQAADKLRDGKFELADQDASRSGDGKPGAARAGRQRQHCRLRGLLGCGAAHSNASLVASSRIDSSTAEALREAARRKAVRASLLTLRRMPLVA